MDESRQPATAKDRCLWFDRFQLGWACLIAPFFLFPQKKFLWILPAVLLAWGVRYFFKGAFFEKTILDWAIAILLVEILISGIGSPDINFSLPKIAGALFGIYVFYILAGALGTDKILRWGIRTYLFGGFLLASIGLLGTAWRVSEVYIADVISMIIRHIPILNLRLPGAEEGFNPNALGGTLLLVVFSVFAFWLSFLKIGSVKPPLFKKKVILIIIYSFLLLYFLFVLFLTQSVICWLAFGMTVWLFFLNGRWKKWSVCFVILFIGIIALGEYLGKPLIEPRKITAVFQAKAEGRSHLWKAGIDAIETHPLFGVGMNRLRLKAGVGFESHAHNQFIHTAAELGIPGLIAYLAILIGAGWMSFEVWRKAVSDWMRIAIQGLAAGQFAFLLFGMGDAIPIGAKAGLFFWISIALITSLHQVMVREIARTK